eukprot:scaffold3838_cov65-Phaeocystis_antarctica.AAC.4
MDMDMDMHMHMCTCMCKQTFVLCMYSPLRRRRWRRRRGWRGGRPIHPWACRAAGRGHAARSSAARRGPGWRRQRAITSVPAARRCLRTARRARAASPPPRAPLRAPRRAPGHVGLQACTRMVTGSSVAGARRVCHACAVRAARVHAHTMRTYMRAHMRTHGRTSWCSGRVGSPAACGVNSSSPGTRSRPPAPRAHRRQDRPSVASRPCLEASGPVAAGAAWGGRRRDAPGGCAIVGKYSIAMYRRALRLRATVIAGSAPSRSRLRSTSGRAASTSSISCVSVAPPTRPDTTAPRTQRPPTTGTTKVCDAWGCSLRCMGLQPLTPGVAASDTWGCSL